MSQGHALFGRFLPPTHKQQQKKEENEKAIPCTLYRFYDAQRVLLYVGISYTLMERARKHRRDKDWFTEATTIELTHCASRSEALAQESRAIKTENPLYNIVGREKKKPANDLVDQQEMLRSLVRENFRLADHAARSYAEKHSGYAK